MICENCFNDGFLADHIRAKGTSNVAVCNFCGAMNVRVIEPVNLADLVSPVMDLYIESGDVDAMPISYFLKRDWEVLKGPDETKCLAILDAIFPGEGVSSKKYKSRQAPTSRLTQWESFQGELKYKNRFFPQTEIIQREELQRLFEYLILNVSSTDFFRARICEIKGQKIAIEKMGRPPEGGAKGGRANPIGISYLYVASDPQTSIAEVRPSVGDSVCVARLASTSGLTLLDLRNPRATISPFKVDGEDNLLGILNNLDFLCKLGEQLSKPVLPKEAELEYLASQYLCEMIKHFKYDGVIFKSSVGAGYNVAFFDDTKLTMPSEIDLYSVERVEYESRPIMDGAAN